MPNLYTDLLQMRMPSLGDLGWDDEVNDNTKITDFVLGSVLKKNMVISGCAVTDGGGLGVDVAAGFVAVGNTEFTIAAVSKTCTDAALNFIYVDDAGAVQVNTTAPTGEYCALALVDAAAAAIDRIGDCRNFLGPKVVSNNPHGDDNKIINPIFNNWQRYDGSTPFTTSGGFSADRKRLAFMGSSLSVAPTTGTTLNGYFYSENGLAVTLTPDGAVSSWAQIQERIENVGCIQNTRATINIKANIPIGNSVALELVQNFGSGGSAEVDEILGSDFLVGTGADKIYTFYVDLPSISGKTIGTDNYLFFKLWLDAGSNFNGQTNSMGHQPAGTIIFYAWQIRPGVRDDIFEIQDERSDLYKCYPYFYMNRATGAPYARFGMGFISANSGSTVTYVILDTPAPMRSNTIVLGYGGGLKVTANGAATINTFALNNHTRFEVNTEINLGSALTAGDACILHAQNDATAWISLDAEL